MKAKRCDPPLYLRVALGEAGVTYLYVDVRLSLYAGYRDIAEVFARSLRAS